MSLCVLAPCPVQQTVRKRELIQCMLPQLPQKVYSRLVSARSCLTCGHVKPHGWMFQELLQPVDWHGMLLSGVVLQSSHRTPLNLTDRIHFVSLRLTITDRATHQTLERPIYHVCANFFPRVLGALAISASSPRALFLSPGLKVKVCHATLHSSVRAKLDIATHLHHSPFRERTGTGPGGH